jgi:hypothetical protein
MMRHEMVFIVVRRRGPRPATGQKPNRGAGFARGVRRCIPDLPSGLVQDSPAQPRAHKLSRFFIRSDLDLMPARGILEPPDRSWLRRWATTPRC